MRDQRATPRSARRWRDGAALLLIAAQLAEQAEHLQSQPPSSSELEHGWQTSAALARRAWGTVASDPQGGVSQEAALILRSNGYDLLTSLPALLEGQLGPAARAVASEVILPLLQEPPRSEGRVVISWREEQLALLRRCSHAAARIALRHTGDEASDETRDEAPTQDTTGAQQA